MATKIENIKRLYRAGGNSASLAKAITKQIRDTLQLTTSEMNVVIEHWNEKSPTGLFTNHRANYFALVVSGRRREKHSYSVLMRLIEKRVIDRVEKPYHAYEAILYRFTDKFIQAINHL